MRRISWLAEVPVNFSIRTLARCRKHEIPDTQGRFCPPPKSNKPSYVTVWEGSSVRFTAFPYLVLCCMSARLSPSEKGPVYVLRHFRILFYAVCPPACHRLRSVQCTFYGISVSCSMLYVRPPVAIRNAFRNGESFTISMEFWAWWMPPKHHWRSQTNVCVCVCALSGCVRTVLWSERHIVP